MKENSTLGTRAGLASAHDDNASAVKVLAVGDTREWQRDGNVLPARDVAFIAFEQLDENLLASLQPSIIFSPILARSFDCIELAVLLQRLGYSGAYRAVSADIPNPGLIESEVRQLCPQVDFRIVKPL